MKDLKLAMEKDSMKHLETVSAKEWEKALEREKEKATEIPILATKRLQWKCQREP